MRFTNGHGAAVVGGHPGMGTPAGAARTVPHYAPLFDDIAPFPVQPGTTEALDDLAAAMIEPDGQPDLRPTGIPAVMTYFGQFIVHDISASLEVEIAGETPIKAAEITPLSQAELARHLRNEAEGQLRLHVLYEPDNDLGQPGGPLAAAMRDGALMRCGSIRPASAGTQRGSAWPGDDLADLPRVGPLLSEGVIAERDLPAEIAPDGANAQRDRVNLLRPLIGDDRNEDNLILSQLHLALLRFHNAIVRSEQSESIPAGSEDELFTTVRAEVVRIYQWLIVNRYLPMVCGRETVDAVLDEGAPLFTDFLTRAGWSAQHGHMPLPTEVVFAVFRFGHSMVRGAYDFNDRFGRKPEEFGSDGFGSKQATLEDLFKFTWRAGMDGEDAVPPHWIADWRRLALDPGGQLDRQARPIDTRVAPPLDNLAWSLPSMGGAFEALRKPMLNLARRTLRRGYLYGLPSGQALFDRMEAQGIPLGRKLTPGDFAGDPAHQRLQAGGFDVHTPLWFYVLKEAELFQHGRRLGPLGARLLAETLIGVLLHDPDSCLRRTGSGEGGFWCPIDACQPKGEPVNSIPALLRAAGVLA